MRPCWQVIERCVLEEKIVEDRFEQARPTREAMKRRPHVETLETSRERSRRHQADNLDRRFDRGDGESDGSNRDEGGGDLDAKRAEQLASHRGSESWRQQFADSRLERGEVTSVCVEIGADHAAAGHGRKDGDSIEKPEPVERAQAAEMERDGAGTSARQS